MRFFCLLALMILVDVNAFSQTPPPPAMEEETEEGRIENAMAQFLEAHRHKFMFFRYSPLIHFRAGLDGNSIFGDEDIDAQQKEEDIFFEVTPQLNAGIKFGSRAFFRTALRVPILYYVENTERRGVFNNLAGEFVTGSSDVLVTAFGTYIRTNSNYDEELDEPVEHRLATGGFRVEHPLGHRTSLHHSVIINQTLFTPPDVDDLSFTLHDRRTISLTTGAAYAWTRTLGISGNFNVRRSEALDTGQITDAWHVLGGVDFYRTNWSGRAHVGYGVTDREDESGRNNFVLDGSVDRRLGRSSSIGLFVSRRYEFSVLDDRATRLVTQAGVRFHTNLTDRFGLNGFYTVGMNDYGEDPVGGTIVNSDTFHRADIGLTVRFVRFVHIRPGVFYYRRNTPIPELDKEGYGWNISLGAGYTLQF